MLSLSLALPAVRRLGSNPNLLTFPSQFDNAVWPKTQLTATADQSTAPDGTLTMDALTPAALAGDHYIRRSTIGQQINTTYTFSVYGKDNGYDWVALRTFAITGSPRVWYNLNTGAVGTAEAGVTASIQAAANGSFRAIYTFTIGGSIVTADTLDIFVCSADNGTSFTGNGTSGVFLWGAKLEVGSVATPI